MNSEKFIACITACFDCAVACKYCANQDLKELDNQMLGRCIRLNHDCAAMCLLAVEAMAGSSEFTKQICTLCAEMCTACAIECEKHTHMEHCRKCAEACRKCAIECTNMTI